MKRHFFLKLIPPRPSFAQDMNDEEKQLMQEHGMYWTSLAQEGVAILFGPVIDPKGSYGIGVVEVENDGDVNLLTANDPVTKSGRQFKHEAYVMPRLVLREQFRPEPRKHLSEAPGDTSSRFALRHLLHSGAKPCPRWSRGQGTRKPSSLRSC